MSPKQLAKVVGIVVATLGAMLITFFAISAVSTGIYLLIGSGPLFSLVSVAWLALCLWAMFRVGKYGAAQAQRVAKPAGVQGAAELQTVANSPQLRGLGSAPPPLPPPSQAAED